MGACGPRPYDPRRFDAVDAGGPGHLRCPLVLTSEAEFERASRPEEVWRRVEAHVRPGEAELVRTATYLVRITRSWRHGRVLLAGDAANEMPPFLAQGMCSGIRDAQNPTFKLVAVRRCDCPLTSGLLAAAEGPGRGVLSAQGRVDDGARRDRLDAVVGPGAHLLTTAGVFADLAPIPRCGTIPWRGTATPPAYASWGSGAGGGLGDPDGTYRAWFAELGAVAILVRPDFYVYGCAGTTTETRSLIEEFTHEDKLSLMLWPGNGQMFPPIARCWKRGSNIKCPTTQRA